MDPWLIGLLLFQRDEIANSDICKYLLLHDVNQEDGGPECMMYKYASRWP